MSAKAMITAGLLLAAGCGNSTTSTTPDMAPPADMTPVCVPDNQPIALAGRYGARVTLGVNTKVPSDCAGDSCIVDTDTVSRMLLLVDVVQVGSKLTLTTQPCHFDIPPVTLKGQSDPTQLTASDALMQSVKALMSTATLDGPNTCAGFVPDPLPIVVGVKLTDAVHDPMPAYMKGKNPPAHLCDQMASSSCDTTKDTGCFCDLDGDGKGGATALASGIPVLSDVDKVYLGLRSIFSLHASVWPAANGQAVPGQRFKGGIADLTIEQNPIGCHHSPSGGGAPYDCSDADVISVVALNPRLSQSATTPSTFVAVPVAQGETCAQLITDAPTLFRNQ